MSLSMVATAVGALTIHDSLSMVLGTRCEGCGSIVPSLCGHGDELSLRGYFKSVANVFMDRNS